MCQVREITEVASFVVKLDRSINSDVVYIMDHLAKYLSEELIHELEYSMYQDVMGPDCYIDCDEEIEEIEEKFPFKIPETYVKYSAENIVNEIRSLVKSYLNDSSALTGDQLGLLLTLSYTLNCESLDNVLKIIQEKPLINGKISTWKYIFAKIFGIDVNNDELSIDTSIDIGRGFERINIDQILKSINGCLKDINIIPLVQSNEIIEADCEITQTFRTKFAELPDNMRVVDALLSENLYTLRKHYVRLNNTDYTFYNVIAEGDMKFAHIYSNTDSTKFFIVIDSLLLGCNPKYQKTTMDNIIKFREEHPDTTVHFTQELAPGVMDAVSKSIILQNFDVVENKYLSDQCTLVEVTADQADEFYNYHNIMYSPKNLKNSINIGLKYNDELVYCASFIKPRFNNSFDFEMVRSNAKVNSIVPGGLKMIVNAFAAKHDVKSIVAYSNNMYCTGERYKQAGFSKTKDLAPTRYCFKDDSFELRYCTNKTIKDITLNDDYYINNLGSKEWVLNLK